MSDVEIDRHRLLDPNYYCTCGLRIVCECLPEERQERAEKARKRKEREEAKKRGKV